MKENQAHIRAHVSFVDLWVSSCATVNPVVIISTMFYWLVMIVLLEHVNIPHWVFYNLLLSEF